MVTRQDVARHFNIATNNVKQVKSQQLFIVDDYSSLHSLSSNCRYLVSYLTIIGIYDYNNLTWYITTKKYSVTTSKQTSQFIRPIASNVEKVNSEQFQAIRDAIRCGLPAEVEVKV